MKDFYTRNEKIRSKFTQKCFPSIYMQVTFFFYYFVLDEKIRQKFQFQFLSFFLFFFVRSSLFTPRRNFRILKFERLICWNSFLLFILRTNRLHRSFAKEFSYFWKILLKFRSISNNFYSRIPSTLYLTFLQFDHRNYRRSNAIFLISLFSRLFCKKSTNPFHLRILGKNSTI